MRRDLPSGVVTFVFTDVEGSTKLLHALGAEAYAEELAEHRRVVREACTAQGGVEIDTQGDAFFLAFPTAREATEAAQAITEELASGPITLRIGLHTGTPFVTEEGYVGDDVHFAARVAASAHGGQVVLSQATRTLLDERYSLRELGEHRLKDIPEPVAIYQLGDGQFPPLKTISNTNLPRPASSFVGRERELSELLARIEGGARLLTLSGPGGSGKTRLALEAAATLVPDYKAGVFWVGLASLRDAALVTQTIAQILGAKDGLAGHIGERELLLLLDNFEQVIEAAPELSALLSACPNLTLLVTSRELLRVQGEVEYPVPPLAEAEAVSLFCERAQTGASEEITELCRRLDHLPLAVELAAARAKALSPRQILERLSQRLDLLRGGRDADPRQQTLRATIEWSYDLLSDDEKELFRGLSVFAGGCTLDAAEEVADADLDTLQSLVEKSLLRFSNERYWMLETIHEFAADRLHEDENADAPARHAAWAIDFLEHQPSLAEGSDVAFGALRREHDNIRAALGWMLEAGQTAAALRLATGDVNHFWWASGHLREGHDWLKRLLSGEGSRSPELEARALTRLSFLASELTDAPGEAYDYAKAAIEMWSELSDVDWLIRSLNGAGNALSNDHRYEEAVRYWDDAIELAAKAGRDGWMVTLSINKAQLLLETGKEVDARKLLVEALGRARESGVRTDLEAVLSVIGVLDALDRRDEAAWELREALTISDELAITIGVAACLSGLATIAADAGRPEEAVLLASAAEMIELERGDRPTSHTLRARERALAVARSGLAAAEFAALRARGSAMELEQAIELALAVEAAPTS